VHLRSSGTVANKENAYDRSDDSQRRNNAQGFLQREIRDYRHYARKKVVVPQTTAATMFDLLISLWNRVNKSLTSLSDFSLSILSGISLEL
jgi:hypothetical protein